MRDENQLVARLSAQDRERLLVGAENIHLAPGEVLFERGEEAAYVFFCTAGTVLLSVPAHMKSGLGLLLIGREGMLGMHRVLGSNVSPFRAVVQTGGTSLRINATTFGEALTASASLHRAMLEYVGTMSSRLARAALCTRFREIGDRLAGWLLIKRDREGADSFHATQDSLARTLGVRRVGVHSAAREFKRLRLIDYHRGEVTVLDVPGLRAIARDCYCALYEPDQSPPGDCATHPDVFASLD